MSDTGYTGFNCELLVVDSTSLACNEYELYIKSDKHVDTNIVDSSYNYLNINSNGNVKHVSSVNLFNGNSVLSFDENDSLSITKNSNNLNINGDFTLEFWVYSKHTPQNQADNDAIITSWNNLPNISSNWQIVYDNSERFGFYFWFNNQAYFIRSEPGKYKAESWHHIAMVGNNNVIKAYINGHEQSGQIVRPSTWSDLLSIDIIIGSRLVPDYPNNVATTMWSNMYIQDLRLVKKSVYNGSFIQPIHF